MSDSTDPLFRKDYVKRIFFGLRNPRGPFPTKLYAHALVLSDDPILYVPRIYADIIVEMDDDDSAVGNSYCSECKNNIGLFDAYCCHCGAKLRNRKILGRDDEENSSIHISH